VYVSFGHVQVNTAVMPPMTHALFRWFIPVGRPRDDGPSDVVTSAGGRIYVDATPLLRLGPFAEVFPMLISGVESTIADRLAAAGARPAFAASRSEGPAARPRVGAGLMGPVMLRVVFSGLFAGNARVRDEIEALMETEAERFSRQLAREAPGAARVRFARSYAHRVFRGLMVPRLLPPVLTGVIAWKLLGRWMQGRIEPRVVDAISRGLPGNVTTEMDLQLGDLADLARAQPKVAACLREHRSPAAIERLRTMPAAAKFIAGWDDFIARYGHRCAGEIDIAVPRWSEDPSMLVTTLVGMLHDDKPGTHRERHAAATRQAEDAAAQIIAAAGGPLRRAIARFLIARTRGRLGMREHPKFFMVRVLAGIRSTILEGGQMLVERGDLAARDDVWMLDLDELIDALEASSATSLRAQVATRRAALQRDARLSPPPVITSDGEAPAPLERGEALPANMLGGIAASAGIAEGIARVVRDPAREILRAGEILVAPFTDPGWTPLFVHAAGLVMEVGGLLTHGSVVAREYGIPAVVGVASATERIRTGQRIRVDGDRGRVTLLADAVPTAAAAE
jgi:pyruvate,water dikinase